MKIQRLRVAELRQFRQPLELADIQPGLNIFGGANEAGKSTLVRAIRAACFERHRSTSVDDLRPYGDAAAAPAVELDFEIAGTAYRLSKSFLHKKRCELMAGTRRLEGVEAEDFLAQLLGFQFSAKGASRDEHQGVPGLLWIEQGQAQNVRGAVQHAADHLRAALDASLGEVTATGGDEVAAQVRKWREELLTGTGKPRAEYQKAIDEDAAQQAQVLALQQAVDQYRSQVDTLKTERERHAQDSRDPPWIALRGQQANAQAALQAADALAGERDRQREQLRQGSALRAVLNQGLQATAQRAADLATREAALTSAMQRHEQATEAEALALQTHTRLTLALSACRESLARARRADTRATLQAQARDASTRADELAALLQRARAEHERASQLQREATRLQLNTADVATLKQQHSRLAELQIQQAAAATRLRFELQAGATLLLDGQPLQGTGEHLLVAASTLSIPGVGQLNISPGGQDLAALAQEQAQWHDAHQALLQRLGLAHLAEAETRLQTHTQRRAEAEAALKACKLIAPKGLDALQADLDGAQARHAEALHALAQLPTELPVESPIGEAVATDNKGRGEDEQASDPTVDLNVDPSRQLALAQTAHDEARDAAEAASRHLQTARQTLAATASQLQAAGQERDTLKALLDDPRQQAEAAAQRAQWLEAGVRESAAQAALAEVEARIAAARPDLLRLDIERFRRSAEIAEAEHHARGRLIAATEAALAAAGAQGLEESLAQAQANAAQAQRRLEELRRRAEALDLLLGKLEQRRQALTRRLQAPLQKHLDRYLQLLFPSGQLQVDEQLVPGMLSRNGPRGTETGDFDTLSFGAREQMGVISRLAYADLLQEAGRPTLIILDDALVHSDEARLSQMKRVLLDAAQRHQLLLFTCHPAQWRDMGVAVREIRA